MSGTGGQAQQRNAELRSALAGQFPGTTFRVRNGRRGRAAIAWGDGPSSEAVRLALRQGPANVRTWAFDLTRTASPLLMSASYVRDLRQGVRFYWTGGGHGVPVSPARTWPPAPATERGCQLSFEDLDARDVHAQEWVAAGVAVAMAESCGVVLGGSRFDDALNLAEVVYHAADAIEGALGGTA